MEQDKGHMIAVCGLDCEVCDIRRVPTDPEAADRIVGWFRHEGWLQEGEGVAEIVERGMYCQGCHGDRSVHWSANCWILECCVDRKGLTFCYQCSEFPCARLSEWAQENEQYAAALARLREMRQASEAE